MTSTPVPLGTDIQVNTYTTSDQRQPAIASLEGGGFVIVWSSLGQDGSYSGVFGQRFDEDGLAVGPEFQVNTTTDNTQGFSSVAALPEPIGDDEIVRHRAVAVADSATRLTRITVNLLPGQDVLTVSSMQAKIEAQLRCLGCGFVPEVLVREHVRHGRLVVKQVKRQRRVGGMAYAWRSAAVPQPKKAPQGLALQWWVEQLSSPATRQALLDRHSPQHSLRGCE